jgi:predicted  nucleic acid-binding Zn-ribbon protein
MAAQTAQMDTAITKEEIDSLNHKIDKLNSNFSHLRNYLTVLSAALVDKSIISNQERAILDNELRGM